MNHLTQQFIQHQQSEWLDWLKILKHITTSYFKDEGDLIYFLGEDKEELGGSEYAKVIHNKVAGEFSINKS